MLKNNLGDVGITLDLHAKGDLQTPLVDRHDRGRSRDHRSGRHHRSAAIDRATCRCARRRDRAISATRWRPAARRRVVLGHARRCPTTSCCAAAISARRDGPIGFGAINVTVGGALSISKDPDEPTDVRGRSTSSAGTTSSRAAGSTSSAAASCRSAATRCSIRTLNVTAERIITGVTARVRVTGTARRPEIQLSSTPPLDESDILSLIVFNEPANQLLPWSGCRWPRRAGTIAARAVATPLADSVARALNLDLFEIRPFEDDAPGGATIIDWPADQRSPVRRLPPRLRRGGNQSGVVRVPVQRVPSRRLDVRGQARTCRVPCRARSGRGSTSSTSFRREP